MSSFLSQCKFMLSILLIYSSLVKEKQKPTVKISFAVFLALAGTFLLMTNGTTNQFTVSLVSVVWGVLSGGALAFYTLASAKLLKTWQTMLVVGWGMVIGGTAMCWLIPSFVPTNIVFGVDTWLLIIFVVLFGTLIAFLLFVESIRHLSPTESSLLSSVEPLSAVLASIVFLHVPFGIFQAVGAACILWTVFLLSDLPKKRMYRNMEGV
ncbi:EamA family transporter [Anoxybacteroides amylolyticum]|uniref:EamA-like transporter family protein n=1 Tax=Anoxybacteroides amylolyticum TaxID=294699 RepID=A0A167T4G6_9BACL|nr:DMT family transporter [Anoxybacillus amylolyticus]ANB59438.1 eamA-like transporter family protein [Anoxybacillus amylolyticus]